MEVQRNRLGDGARQRVSGRSTKPVTNLFNYNGTLVFSANSVSSGTELWKSDGTTEGTVMIRDISPGATSSSPKASRWSITYCYFSARTESQWPRLWRSNGTEGGTTLVRDVSPGAGSGLDDLPMVNVNGILYFSGETGLAVESFGKATGSRRERQWFGTLPRYRFLHSIEI